MQESRLLITGASDSYGSSLLALLGSLNLNWPNHPPVLVYDIGLSAPFLQTLAEHGIQTRKVPAFCAHWRKHFAWKIWCLNDAPAHDILWMDAGIAVLRPVDEVFGALAKLGYFLCPNYQLLDWEASDAAREGCAVRPQFRLGKLTLAGTWMGFRKEGRVLRLLREALSVASVEKFIAATECSHRHDQAIISCTEISARSSPPTVRCTWGGCRPGRLQVTRYGSTGRACFPKTWPTSRRTFPAPANPICPGIPQRSARSPAPVPA